MKKELSYFVWNGFLAASLIAAKLLGLHFPVVIVGWLAGFELAVCVLVSLCMSNKEVRAAIRKTSPVKLWRAFVELAIISVAVLCGNKAIAGAWVMIAGLYFYITVYAESKKEEDESPAP